MTKTTTMMGRTPWPSAPYHHYHQLGSNDNVQLQLFATQLTALTVTVVRPHSRTHTAVIVLVLRPLLLPPLLPALPVALANQKTPNDASSDSSCALCPTSWQSGPLNSVRPPKVKPLIFLARSILLQLRTAIFASKLKLTIHFLTAAATTALLLWASHSTAN